MSKRCYMKDCQEEAIGQITLKGSTLNFCYDHFDTALPIAREMLGLAGIEEMHTTEEEIYTTEEVAEFLKVKPITIMRKIRQGKIKAFQVDGNSGPYRITRAARNAYINEMTTVQQMDNLRLYRGA